MAVYQDLLDAIARVRTETGDPDAWMQGLSADELALVASPITINSPGLIDVVLAKIQAPRSGGAEIPPGVPVTAGDAARAINIAETSLAQQDSVTAQLDLQVVSAILNAHATNTTGSGALDALQREVESAVVDRANLDTPAGARELQRFLTGLLREIKTVVESSSLDATSKAALAAALASLYRGSPPAGDTPPNAGDEPQASREENAGLEPPAEPLPEALGADPLLDELLAPESVTTPVGAAPMPSGFTTPGLPQLPAIPGLGSLGSAPSSGMPSGGIGLPTGGLPMPDPLIHSGTEGDSPAESAGPAEADPPDASDDPDTAAAGKAGDENDELTARDPGEQTIELPTGEVITAPSPELAKAIAAAVAGTPIAEAFQAQGITLPAPGTVVTDPLDPVSLAPGDIGVFADRHALALGNGKAVLNNQIQPIENVAGPGFLGWEHPPSPGATTQSDDRESPAPTRPAVTVTPSE